MTIRKRACLSLLLPIVVSVLICGTLPLAAQTPLLRHRTWWVVRGGFDVRIGDTADRNGKPVFSLTIENTAQLFLFGITMPLPEPGRYWYITVAWSKQRTFSLLPQISMSKIMYPYKSC